MKSNSTSLNLLAASAASAALALALLASVAGAQQKSMSAEELEQYILEQKAALEAVKSNRDETEKKSQEVRDALEEQEARRALVEEELDMLCKEQEELKAGTYDDCKASDSN